MDSKSCMKCGDVKPLSAFYKHPKMADGTVNKCKECNKKDVRENRASKIDYYTEYERSRAITDRRKSQVSRYGHNWRNKNIVKRSAQVLAGRAMRRGDIARPCKCSACGKLCSPHGHHDDYSKPMDIRWLCAKCHNAWHREHGEALNG